MQTNQPTIAQKVIGILTSKPTKAYSLYAGQVEFADGDVGRFQGGFLFSEKRNEKGRAIKSVYGYADGSQIEYSWTESRGPQVREIGKWLK